MVTPEAFFAFVLLYTQIHRERSTQICSEDGFIDQYSSAMLNEVIQSVNYTARRDLGISAELS